MPFIEQFAQQQAGNLANAGMGLLFQGLANQQNFQQAKKMQALQIKGSKELTDYNRRSQFQMWLDTNFPAQVAQAEAAGLNPGLLYSGAGGGGATTGSGGGALPTAGTQKSAEPMGMQVLTTAQLKLIEAETNKTNAEAQKIAGVDTKKAEGEIANLAALTTNEKAKNALIKAESAIANFNAQVAEKGIDFAIRSIEANAKIAEEELEQLQRNNEINNATKEEAIGTIRANYIGALLENQLKVSQNVAIAIANELVKAKTQTENETRRNIVRLLYHQGTQAMTGAAANNAQVTQGQQRVEIESDRNDIFQQGVNFGALDKIIGPIQNILTPTPNRNPIGFK